MFVIHSKAQSTDADLPMTVLYLILLRVLWHNYDHGSSIGHFVFFAY